MSDIEILGVAGLLGALATLALGGIGVFFGAVLALTQTERRRERVVSYCAGPLACSAVGAVAVVIVRGLGARQSDQLALAWPLLGIVAWVALAAPLAIRGSRRRRRGRRAQPRRGGE